LQLTQNLAYDERTVVDAVTSSKPSPSEIKVAAHAVTVSIKTTAEYFYYTFIFSKITAKDSKVISFFPR
jgi:hypothetical protein